MTHPWRDLFDNPLKKLPDSDREGFRCWEERSYELEPLAGPILYSPAVARLGKLSFLGILSPRFAPVAGTPLFPGEREPTKYDGSRRSHSIGVALVGLDIARSLGFSEEATRYVVAWGLLHDIGNWPLSHTGQFSFERLTGVKVRDLRRDIISNARSMPGYLHLRSSIKEAGLDVAQLLALFDRRTDDLPDDLQRFAALLNSPLSPDILEGMWRAGGVFGVGVDHPSLFAKALQNSLFAEIHLKKEFSKQAISFWRKTATIYDRFINRRSVVLWESAWSLAICREFEGIGLQDSLELDEECIVKRVLEHGVPSGVPLSRYKPPMEYTVELAFKRTLPTSTELNDLAAILTQRQQGSGRARTRFGGTEAIR